MKVYWESLVSQHLKQNSTGLKIKRRNKQNKAMAIEDLIIQWRHAQQTENVSFFLHIRGKCTKIDHIRQ